MVYSADDNSRIAGKALCEAHDIDPLTVSEIVEWPDRYEFKVLSMVPFTTIEYWVGEVTKDVPEIGRDGELVYKVGQVIYK